MKLLTRPLVAFALFAATLSFTLTSRADGGIPSLQLRNAFPDLKFNRPLWLEEIPDGSKRLVVVEQGGTVYLLPQGRNSKDVKIFLDITERRPYEQNEEGL